MKTILAIALFAASAQACLWDSDTLAMEKARFPGVAEIISGRFPRHSPEFYEWRKTTATERLTREPKNAALYDDLAVAQHKLGDHPAAIATMLAKEKAVPGLYETYSNLGTFYIYTGQLEEARKWIARALAINPNAHFGREKYQKWLVDWVLAGKPQTGNAKNDKEDGLANLGLGFVGFAKFVADQTSYQGRPGEWRAGRVEALKGVAGMMRFADYDNPLLLEALGDLLMVGSLEDNASHLAAQAYLLASRKSDGAERQRLLEKMDASGRFMQGFRAAEINRQLNAGLATAKTLTETIADDEKKWIDSGANVAVEFEKKYLGGKK